MTNPLLSTTARLDRMTGRQLDSACSAVKYILSDGVREHIADAMLIAKLTSLRDDLATEQETRRAIAKH